MSNTFYCSSSTVCSSLPPAALSDSALNAMIVNGTLESEEYAEESRAIAEEYLYRELADDSALWFSDSTYIQFMLDKGFENTGNLYDAEEYIKAAYSFDSVFINLIDSCNLQITILTDSIEKLKDLGWYEQAEQLAYTIGFLNQTINNLYIVREATINNILAEAELKNDYVVNGELPEINAALINEIEINFLETGGNIEVLQNNYSGIYSIASQCPYSGGGAVERARSLISFINDSVVYNDDFVCLQNGVYRFAKDSIDAKELNKIIVQPNPANDKVKIKLEGNVGEGICKIIIRNSVGEIVLNAEMNCNERQKLIDVSFLAQGVYSINVNANNVIQITEKLVIIR